MKLKDPRLLKTQALIDGQWLDADDGGSIPVVNPADGEVIARVARCQGTETRRAIEAASRAFQDWR
ncbi:MAG: aldehyde dehydrogenase family protein, partial [Gammaproteobacteria bacterium]|nr:aldehyde dehydrogenase family protein [Gammaproteobacteria bacterium]